MSVLIWRNKLNKIHFKSCHQFAKNLKLLNKNGCITINPKFLLQPPQKPSKRILRDASSNTLTIKQYESRRKYVTVWKLERLMGWLLVVLIPTAFVMESKELEMTLSTVALLHTYWGCQSVCSDYLRSSVVGKLLPRIVRLSIVLFSLTSLVGAYQLIYEDVGLIHMIKKFWSIRGRDYISPKQLRKVEEKPRNIFNMFLKNKSK